MKKKIVLSTILLSCALCNPATAAIVDFSAPETAGIGTHGMEWFDQDDRQFLSLDGIERMRYRPDSGGYATMHNTGYIYFAEETIVNSFELFPGNKKDGFLTHFITPLTIIGSNDGEDVWQLTGIDLIDDMNWFRWLEVATDSTEAITQMQFLFANSSQSTNFFPSIDNIETSAVPIPGGVWLLGSGLIGLVSMSRRRE